VVEAWHGGDADGTGKDRPVATVKDEGVECHEGEGGEQQSWDTG
jgi:hypothetical protein